ncbi:MAG: chorismate-binding protein [Oligoflexales bacterium]|nr:chorismate-binding protein [Oligoflexales bacterium]
MNNHFRHRFWRVQQGLIFDNAKHQLWAFDASSLEQKESLIADFLPQMRQKIKKIKTPSADQSLSYNAGHLSSKISNSAYLDLVKQVQEDIKSGRYYQLNLLRYFENTRLLSFAEKLARLRYYGASYSSWIYLSDLEVLSFSPEQFIEIDPIDEKHAQISTFPIKGSIARSNDPANDLAAAAKLLASKKDLAELHMIVDLMRNDLHKIAVRHSVSIENSNALKSLAHIHHLFAVIRAKILPDLTLQNILSAVCPAGSISGAPKIEVMKAIKEYENRPRNYFMGNIFYQTANGKFDSSILIRTLVGKGYQSDSPLDYAAGSGITINSDAETEMKEIDLKCASVLRPLNVSKKGVE